MPDINRSSVGAWPEDGEIRMGLSQVRSLGGNWRDRAKGRSQAEAGISIEEMTANGARIVAERERNGPYRSLNELLTRTRINKLIAEALVRSGALDGFGMPRRELLWQLGLLTMPETARVAKRSRVVAGFQPALALPVSADMVRLPGLSDWNRLAWDFDAMGVTGGSHPMALVRPLLHEGLITSRHLGGPGNPNRLPQGAKVEMAGMVVTRQKPSTASGVMFMLLEDEFGMANVVIYIAVQERHRELVRATPFVIIRGRIDNVQSGFPNIIADHFAPCPLPGLIPPPDSHDFG